MIRMFSFVRLLNNFLKIFKYLGCLFYIIIILNKSFYVFVRVVVFIFLSNW